ncbi:MAG: hypothetical protein HQL13_06065 [Candidatus Omnitrophica bacterium]|nr:hypothetical protein [Candidatus Omnitrophota bacterium]
MRATWRLLIAELMTGGAIPTREKVLEALGFPNQRLQRITLELFFDTKGPQPIEYLYRLLDGFIAQTAAEMHQGDQGVSQWPKMEEDVKKSVQEVKADGRGLGPDIYNVAERLYVQNREFQSWVSHHQAGAVASVDAGRFQWLKTHYHGITDDQIKEKVAKGELLVSWIQDAQPTWTDLEIFKQFGIFVPTEAQLDWQAQYAQGLNDMGPFLGFDEMKPGELLDPLTSLLWFFDTFTNAQILGFKSKGQPIEVNEEEIEKERAYVAQRRFLHDTMDVSYHSNSEAERLIFLTRKYDWVDAESMPDGVRSKLMTPYEDFTGPQEKRLSLLCLFLDLMNEGLKDNKQGPFVLRAVGKRRFSKMVMLLCFSETMREVMGGFIGKAPDEQKMEQRAHWLAGHVDKRFYFWRFYPLLEELTWEHLVEALNNCEEPVSLEEFREWVQKNKLQDMLSDYGLRDWQEADFRGWQDISWQEMEAEIRGAIKTIQSEGLVPEINDIIMHLYHYFPRLWRWMEEQRKIKDFMNNPAIPFVEWLRRCQPEWNLKKIGYFYRCFVPARDHFFWEDDLQRRAGRACYRPDFGKGRRFRIVDVDEHVDVDLREFEARLTALSWFTNECTNEELEKIFPSSVNKAEEYYNVFKKLEEELRYLWDTKGVSYLSKRQIFSLWNATNVAFQWSNIPRSFRSKFRVPPQADVANNIFSFFLYQFMPGRDVQRMRSMFQFRSAYNHHRRLAMISTYVTARKRAASFVIPATGALSSEQGGRAERKRALRERENILDGVRRILPGFTQGSLEEISSLQTSLPDIRRFMLSVGEDVEDFNAWIDSPDIRDTYGFSKDDWGIVDGAMAGKRAPGGIDLNGRNLAMIIKRDDHGMPLPVLKQDLAQLSNFDGLYPVIEFIQPASQTRFLSHLFQ